MYFFDASALVKRYVREAGSQRVRQLLAAGAPAVARLTWVEIASALARRAREGGLSARGRDRALAALRTDLPRCVVVEATVDVGARAVALLVRHPLRSADALQLASCLELQQGLGTPLSLVTWDGRLRSAARTEGLATLP